MTQKKFRAGDLSRYLGQVTQIPTSRWPRYLTLIPFLGHLICISRSMYSVLAGVTECTILYNLYYLFCVALSHSNCPYEWVHGLITTRISKNLFPYLLISAHGRIPCNRVPMLRYSLVIHFLKWTDLQSTAIWSRHGSFLQHHWLMEKTVGICGLKVPSILSSNKHCSTFSFRHYV